MATDAFAHRYGRWALVAGASEGVGAAFAETVAARGLDVVLVARRQAVLDEVAQHIRDRHGVRTRTVALDLAEGDAAARLLRAVDDLEVGLFVYCAGADSAYLPFLDSPVELAEAMIHRNCTVPAQLAHGLAGRMVQRGRGGIILLGSAAGFVGAPNMAAYAASKAFDMVFAEALWAELRGRGVNVLGLVLGETDTPALRRLRHGRGLAGPDEPVRGAADPQAVVDEGLAYLRRGPTRLAHTQTRRAFSILYPVPRGLAVRLIARLSERAMGPTPSSSGPRTAP